MDNFRKTNNIVGWALFALASMVYIITIEPTASLWDCGEFIAVSYKLQVPHPPGAPFFLLLGRMFSFLAFGDVEKVAFWINMSSALSSGFTILFLYWTIVLLGRKVMKIKSGKETKEQAFLLVGAGIIGALAYTFSDSFWFSAVEAEVYAVSSFFTAFVFWAMLKWELIEDPSTANKWFILIAYMMGLSIGVHLLNLLTIPSLGLIYYFKKYKPTRNGILLTLAISGIIVVLVQYGVIIGLPSVAGSFEIFFVNNIGLPFGAGIIVFAILFFVPLIYGVFYSIKHQKEVLNTALLCFVFILIGYASYAIIVIRSSYNPLINENHPEDIVSVVSYLKREQYGEWPILYGPYFTAELQSQEQGDPVYVKGEEKYEISRHRIKNVYNDDEQTIFPRIHSSRSDHVEAYRQVLGLRPGEKPNFADNIRFLFVRQFGHFYFRYFSWNFIGRESDIQNAGVLWPFESSKDLPEVLADNKARNNYFMLPFILGLIGMFFNLNSERKTFAVVAMLFFMTGMAIILYLNPPPVEPRERDYAYVGSFYAFAIWIGFSVIPIAQFIGKHLKSVTNGAIATTAICLIVPGIMAQQGWDDHNRSNRYFSVDGAKNILNACAPNAILFTGGDNDTFPLWYAQEVEGFRTDVRVIVLTYFNTDWYLQQMRRQAYESEPLPFTLELGNYKQGVNDYLPFIENPNLKADAINLTQFMKLIKDDHPALKIRASFGELNSVPARKFYLNVDTTAVLNKGIIPDNFRDKVTNRMVIPMKGGSLQKQDLMILDLIIANKWERPIYFNNTSMLGVNLDFNNYVVQEGSTFRLLPVYNPGEGRLVDTDKMYENLMNRSFWRELDNPKVYYTTEDYIQRSITPFRSQFNTLAEALLAEGKTDKAAEVINKSLTLMPDNVVPYDFTAAQTIDLLLQVGQKDKAMEIAKVFSRRTLEFLEYYVNRNMRGNVRELQVNIYLLSNLIRSLSDGGESALATEYREKLDRYYEQLNR